jgi:hypothetical protein
MITIGDVLAAVRDANGADIYKGGNWPSKVDQIFAELNRLTSSTLNGKSLYDLLDEQPAGMT